MLNFTYTNINENKLWIENYLEIFNSKKTIFINNYKEVFLRLKKLLRFGDFQDKYNALIMTKKLVYHYFLNQSNEFDFISSFNTIIEDLMIFLGSNNIHQKIAEKIFSKYTKHQDNIEFLVKYILTQGLNYKDWKLRLNCLTLLRILFEEKFSFFVEKKNFTFRVIELLILHSKDKASSLGSFSIQILIELITKLPNYRDINLMLSIDDITDIERIMSNEKTISSKIFKQGIQSFQKTLIKKNNDMTEGKTMSDNLFEDLVEQESELINFRETETTMSLKDFFSKVKGRIQFKGIIFGVFPKNVIEETDPDLLFDIRSNAFEKIKSIFEENFNKDEFLKSCSAFFNFIYLFINDNYNNICLISLEILNKIISRVPGINLLINLLTIIPKLLLTFSRLNSNLTTLSKEIFSKLMMIVPSSKLIPHLLKALIHPNWVVVSDSLEILHTLFDTLPSIYNDIDFEIGDYDINIFLTILKLLRHAVPKVVSLANKILITSTEKVVNKQDFLRNIKLVISDSLYKEISILIKADEIRSRQISDDVSKSYDVSKMIVTKKTKVNEQFKNDYLNNYDFIKPLEEHIKNLDIDPNEIYEEDEMNNLKIYRNVAKFNLFNTSDENKVPINVDENNLMNDTHQRRLHKNNNKIENIIENYSNYKASSPKVKTTLDKSKLKRYNDANDHELETKYDTNYNFEVKVREALSPLKNPESVYFKLYDLLRSNLNWEKQFKAIDYLRKILFHTPEIIFLDSYYLNLLLEEIVTLINNLRTSLVRNSLLALNEILLIKEAPIVSNYEIIINNLIKKVLNKNEFISKEAQRVLDTFVENCALDKATSNLVTLIEANYSSIEYVKVCFKLYTYFIKIYKEDIVKTRNFVQMMGIFTEAFNKKGELKREIKMFLLEMKRYYENNDKYNIFLKRYFSENSYEKLSIWLNE